LRPTPDGFAPAVRAEMEKLFWCGIRALLPDNWRTRGGLCGRGQNGDPYLPQLSTRFPARYGFRLLLPADSGTRFGPRSLERGGKSLHLPPCETTGFCSDAL
jgi:hypothetical protein